MTVPFTDDEIKELSSKALIDEIDKIAVFACYWCQNGYMKDYYNAVEKQRWLKCENCKITIPLSFMVKLTDKLLEGEHTKE